MKPGDRVEINRHPFKEAWIGTRGTILRAHSPGYDHADNRVWLVDIDDSVVRWFVEANLRGIDVVTQLGRLTGPR